MHTSRRGAALVAAGAAAVAFAGLVLGDTRTSRAQAVPPSVVLAPHKAVYDFALARAAAGGVSEMTGRMVYELTGSPCEGYADDALRH
jgi:EipB-like